MNFANDIRLYFLNGFSLVVSFTHVEMALKIILLLVSIIYTLAKIKEIKDNKNKNEDNK